MNNYFLYGNSQTPDIIIGKFTVQGLNSDIINTYGSTEEFKSFSQVQINKYELWFSSTINFIPYSGVPVFVVDTLGNLTNKGNTLTEGTLTVQKTLIGKETSTFEKDLTIDNNLLVNKNVKVNGDLEVKNNVRIDGNVSARNIAGLQAAIDSLGDLKKTLDDLKKTVDELKNEVKEIKKMATEKSTSTVENIE